MSRTVWDKLTPDEQKIVLEVSGEAAIKDRDLTLAAAKSAVDQLKAADVTFHNFPEADKKAWKSANPDFFAEFIAAQEKSGRADAAKSMVKIWKEVVGG